VQSRRLPIRLSHWTAL